MLVSNMTILFQTYSPNYPKKTILVPNLIFSLFCLIYLHFGKFQGADSKCHNHFLSIFILKMAKRIFFSSNLRTFIFARNCFKLTTQNYTNKAFLIPKLKLFMLHNSPFHNFVGADSKFFFLVFSLKIKKKEHFFCPNFFPNLTNSQVLISNMAIIFQT